MKKVLSLLLSVAMLLSLAVPAMAAETTESPVTVSVDVTGHSSKTVGESFVIPVKIANNTGFSNFDFQVEYDKNIFDLTKISVFSSLENEEREISDAVCSKIGVVFSGYEKTGRAGCNIVNPKELSGDLFYLYFTVKSTALNGDSEIGIRISDEGAFEYAPFDGTRTSINATFVPGIITIADGIDANVTIDGGQGFQTIAGALTEIGKRENKKGTINISKTRMETPYISIPAGYDVTIDLQGNTLANDSTAASPDTALFAAEKGSTLSVMSTGNAGKIECAGEAISSASNSIIKKIENITTTGVANIKGRVDCIKNSNFGDLKIDGGYGAYIESTKVSKLEMQTDKVPAELNLSANGEGAQMQSTLVDVTVKNGMMVNGGKVVMQSGTITGSTHGIIQEGSGSILTITGGTVTGEENGIQLLSGTLNVEGGIITGGKYAGLQVNNGIANVTGGELTSTRNNAIYVGAGTLNVTGGYMHTDVKDYCGIQNGWWDWDNSVPVEGGTVTVSGNAKIVANYPISKSGNGTATVTGGYFSDYDTRYMWNVTYPDGYGIMNDPISGGEYDGLYKAGKPYTVTVHYGDNYALSDKFVGVDDVAAPVPVNDEISNWKYESTDLKYMFKFAGFSSTNPSSSETSINPQTIRKNADIYIVYNKTYQFTVSYYMESGFYVENKCIDTGLPVETKLYNETNNENYNWLKERELNYTIGGKTYLFKGWSSTDPAVSTNLIDIGKIDDGIQIWAVYSELPQGEVATDYTLTVKADDTATYTDGNTVTAEIWASGEDSFGSFQFTLAYDNTKLALNKLEANVAGNVSVNNSNTLKFALDGNTPITIPTESIKIATATFTVADNIATDNTIISLDRATIEMTPQGTTGNATPPAVVEKTIGLTASHTITFGAPTNGSYKTANPASVVVLDNALISEVTLPEFTANDNYEFVAWNDGTKNINLATYKVTGNSTLIPMFAAKNYSWSYTETAGVSLSNLTGLTDNKVTYGKDVSFKLTPNAGYVITGVSYSVDGGAATAVAGSNDTYTIPGTNLAGDITLEITTQHYNAVNFVAGTGATLNDTILYVKSGTAGFYIDTACTQRASVPAPVAVDGYRLRNNDGENFWSGSNGAAYTSASIEEAIITADVTLTAQTIKIWNITFTAGANGTLAGETTIIRDQGYTLTKSDVPETSGNAGYTFKEWQLNGSSATPAGTVVNSALAYTADFADAEYDITLDGGAAATITATSGVTEGKAKHGTNVVFTVTPKAGYRVNSVGYTIGSVEHELSNNVIEAGSTQTFTIPGAYITGAVAVTISTNSTFNVSFAAGNNGKVGGTTNFVINKDGKLTQEQFATVITTANPGYKFVEWRMGGAEGEVTTADQIEAAAVTANVTYYAIFDHDSYAVTATELGGIGANATHGTDFTFTPAFTNGLVTSVSYKVGDSSEVTIKSNDDGSYTIGGNEITGDITITATTIANASFSFISAEEYGALSANTKIAVLTTGKLTDSRYLLADGTELYWSSRYNAYVKIVSIEITTAQLAMGLKRDNTAATEIPYTGDLNGNDKVTAADAGMINDIMHNENLQYTPTDMVRFMCDVTDNNDSKTVTTYDVSWVLKK